MAIMQVDIIVDPSSVQHVFQSMADAVGMAELGQFLLTDIDPYIRMRIEQRFQSEGDDVSGRWAALAPATEVIRQSGGFPASHPINQRTHMMRDFLVNEAGQVRVSGLEAVLTHPDRTDPLTEQKIRTAQQGKNYPQTPPRPVLGLSPTDMDYIHIQLTRHLFAGL